MWGQTILSSSHSAFISFSYLPIFRLDDIDARSQMRQSFTVYVKYHLWLINRL